MWTTVYMTQNIDTARAVRKKIEDMDIIVMIRSIKQSDRPGEDCFELLVPSTELTQALEIVIG